jgi:hypothetical protein
VLSCDMPLTNLGVPRLKKGCGTWCVHGVYCVACSACRLYTHGSRIVKRKRFLGNGQWICSFAFRGFVVDGY